ncbi:hypothetical protein GCM10009754_56070 [Amycolatopsis minnesotensis]|uniref:SGNH hydrolase-type esterase domain-containing protein n=2 Tax=Amycolatopsis minnesotensis TaxID=337894 RepID=A0ABN2RRW6_9PSEU
MRVLGWVVPGVSRVAAQKQPYADAWRESNERALRADGPLWAVLGDSMSQGIGAASIRGGWVGQLSETLAESGKPVRVVNLSRTGAGIGDVLGEQMPRLRELPVAPAIVTVLAGANDMVRPRRRPAAVAGFARLLADLPDTAVVATLFHENRWAHEINALIDAAEAGGAIATAELRGPALGPVRGSLAADWFHPNERGYATIANLFRGPVERVLSRRPA